MFSELSTVKLKAQRSANTGSHLATYQGEIIRKSICNDPKVSPSLLRNKNTRKESSLKPVRSALALGRK